MELDVWISYDGYKITAWEGGDWAYDTAERKLAETRSPYFPEGHKAFWIVRDLYISKKYERGDIDEITGYVMLPKPEILKIVDELYCSLDHINKRLDELKKHIEKLPEKDYYKVVFQEF